MNKLYAQIIGSFPFCFSFVLLLRVVDSGISKDIVAILLVSVLFFFSSVAIVFNGEVDKDSLILIELIFIIYTYIHFFFCSSEY